MHNNIYIFIDAANLWEVQKAKRRFFDYEKLTGFIKDKFRGSLIKIFYYTAYPRNGTREYSLDKRHKFFTFLKKGLGFIVRKKELKRISIITDHGQSLEEKGNMDMEITIDALHYFKYYDIAILFTGDSDFLALVSYLRRGGKRVHIFSSKNNVSWELRTSSDGYFDVLKIKNDIWGKELPHHKKRVQQKPPSIEGGPRM